MSSTPGISTETAKLMEWVREGAEKAGDFAIEQAPLLAQEFVQYTLWSSLVYIAVGLVLLVIAAIVAREAIRTLRKEDAGDGEIVGWSFGGSIAVITMAVAGAICVGENLDSAMKAAFAPRVLIVEKIGEIVK